MSHHRYKPDPADSMKTIDLYEQQLRLTSDPMWAVAIELARIADAMEPSPANDLTLFDYVQDLACAAWRMIELKEKLDD